MYNVVNISHVHGHSGCYDVKMVTVFDSKYMSVITTFTRLEIFVFLQHVYVFICVLNIEYEIQN